MHFNVYDVFYSQCSHQHVSAGIATILKVILLKEGKGNNTTLKTAVITVETCRGEFSE